MSLDLTFRAGEATVLAAPGQATDAMPEILIGRVDGPVGHAFANIERTNNLLDLVVCRDRGVFARGSDIVARLRKASLKHKGWSAAPREVADPQPPAPAPSSSMRRG